MSKSTNEVDISSKCLRMQERDERHFILDQGCKLKCKPEVGLQNIRMHC